MDLLAAQVRVRKVLGDADTFRTMVAIGLPTDSLQLPPNLPFALFQRLEPTVKDPTTFMDAGIEYIEYARDANDLLQLARMSRTNGGGPLAVQDYTARCLAALKGAERALDRLVPLLPAY